MNETTGDFLTFRYTPGDAVEIVDIAVNSQRGVGHGSALIADFVASLPATAVTLYAFVRASNEDALRFYRKNQFTQEIVVPGFYQCEDAVLVVRRLTP